ncbi:MAG: hypothetical protein FJZ49_02405 [Candidatus Verstraetearchaeota archaeon]|nr:hypothetical protein [Candidatus Verstraetearchaeota archaeon]
MAVAKSQYQFPNKVVIAPCTGVGQAAGTISRQAAYKVVDELMPDKTVLLCLPAYTIGVEEDIEMVKQNPNRIVVIEGCSNLCMTKLLKEKGYKPAKMVYIPRVIADMKVTVHKSENRAKLGEVEERVASDVVRRVVDAARSLEAKQ